MHIEIAFQNISEETKEIVIAQLADLAEGFEEEGGMLKAFFKAANADGLFLTELSEQLKLPFTKTEIPEQNWNAYWESNFEPVAIADFVSIRADFHPPNPGVVHEIIINPKMSFGTGHHATTALMIRQMKEIDFKGKTVFDFGTGTGILSILARQLGAKEVTASDIDDWSIANAAENFEKNNIKNIHLIQSDSSIQGQNFDIILANINKNVLLQTIPHLTDQLDGKGALLLSGLLQADEEAIVELCWKHELRLKNKLEQDNWICLNMNKLQT